MHLALLMLFFGFCFVGSAVRIWMGKLIVLDVLKSAWMMVALY
jgi:hypothetical protein